MSEKIRIDKILAKSGFGSRNEVKKLIKSGRVKNGGNVVKSSNEKFFPEEITVDGKNVEYKEFVYLLMNKPKGVLTATEDKKQATVLDLIDEKYNNFELFPVGRLDKDTEGLLLLTNDGELAHNLLSPKKHVDKTYFAVLEKEITKEDVEKIENGVDIGGYITKPAGCEIKDNGVYITIHEGKFHQVKKMFETVDNKVLHLKRVAFAKLTLPQTLDFGDYIEIKKEEII